MNLGAPELLILLVVMLGMVPTIVGIVQAARNGDTGWLVGICVGWFVGLGWVIAIAYLITLSGQTRARAAGVGFPGPPTLPPPHQPPAWHPDPTGRFDQRFWDGSRWTDQVQRGGVPGTDRI